MTFNKQTFQDAFGASILEENDRRVVKGKIVARWVDEALTPLLWLAFACAFALCASRASVVGWIVCASLLDFAARFWRESYGVWRDYPYWRSVETTRASSRSVAAPFWTTSACFLTLLFLRAPLTTFFAVAWFLFFVDLFLARWIRRFAERTVRAGIELWISNDSRYENREIERVETAEQSDKLSFEKPEKNGLDVNIETPDDETEEAALLISSQRRTKTADGEERISGEALVEFEEDAEIAVVNIAFCPSFEGAPTFEYEQVSGAEVAIKTTLVQPFGVRLEVRRRNASTFEDASDENEPTRLEFFARYPALE